MTHWTFVLLVFWEVLSAMSGFGWLSLKSVRPTAEPFSPAIVLWEM